MVANDDYFQLMAVAHNLTSVNINVLKRAMNGHEAFQYVKENQEQKIDLVLLDLDMPIMNGYQACQ